MGSQIERGLEEPSRIKYRQFLKEIKSVIIGNEGEKMIDKKKSNFFYAISLALQLGFLIAIPLVGFLLVGVFLDKKFESTPIFTISLVILSLIFVFFEIRYYLLPFLEKRK